MRSLLDSAKLIIWPLLSVASLQATTITYTATDSYGPGTQVTYTELVGGANLISSIPFRSEASSACTTLTGSGCVFASVSDTLPALTIPTGSVVTSAILNLYYTSQISNDGLTVASVTPIFAQQFSSAANPGTHAGSYSTVFDTAAGSVSTAGSQSSVNELGIDYTSAVQTAIAQGAALAPITADETFSYGVSDLYSVHGGTNSSTLFSEDFDLTNASLTAILTVNYAAVVAPEPTTLGMLAAALGVVALGFSARRQL